MKQETHSGYKQEILGKRTVMSEEIHGISDRGTRVMSKNCR
jgi:hypothetical protein